MNLLDFIKRADGTRSDPFNLLPLEEITLTLIGLIHLAVGLVALLSIPGVDVFTTKQAAVVSALVHGLWAGHMASNTEMWSVWLHKDADLNYHSFLTIHIALTALATTMVIFLPAHIKDAKPAAKSKKTI